MALLDLELAVSAEREISSSPLVLVYFAPLAVACFVVETLPSCF